MIIAHYAHRLPADWDLGIIRDRIVQRGRLWDDVARLHFKGFLLSENEPGGTAGEQAYQIRIGTAAVRQAAALRPSRRRLPCCMSVSERA